MLTSPPPIAPEAAALPFWLSIIIAALLIIGSLAVFIGALGLVSFRNFYDRLHMPGLGATAGAAAILLAGAIYASYQHHSLQFRFALILLFLTIAAPIVLMMLARAAAMRDFIQGKFGKEGDIFAQTDDTLPSAENVLSEAERVTAAKRENDERASEAKKSAAQEQHGGKAVASYSETEIERALEIALEPSNTDALDSEQEADIAAEFETALALEKQPAPQSENTGSAPKTPAKKPRKAKAKTADSAKEKKAPAKKPTARKKSASTKTKTDKPKTAKAKSTAAKPRKKSSPKAKTEG